MKRTTALLLILACSLSACTSYKPQAAAFDNDFYYVPAAGISSVAATPGIEAF